MSSCVQTCVHGCFYQFHHHTKTLSVADAVNSIIRPILRSFSELCDTQIRCPDKEGTVTEATLEHERAEAITAD